MSNATLTVGGSNPVVTRLEVLEQLSILTAEAITALLRWLAPAVAAAAPELRTLLADPALRRLQVPLGTDPAGSTVLLDLAEVGAGGHGPHGLLVGATGSGKSVLLRTIVTGLAARHAVRDLQLLLFDYKGGAAFDGLAGLPHVAGVVTNLSADAGLPARVGISLEAELERRQRLLRDAGADSRDTLVEAGGELATLVVVVDEAGELLGAEPQLAEVLGRIGRVGRSLGVHLLVSTQRFDQGRLRSLDAHLRYRVCLRTFTAEDSRATLGSTAAHELPGRPGVGFLSVDGQLRRLDVLGPPDDPGTLVAPSSDRARPVWLPPLPRLLHQRELSSHDHLVVLGMLDEPARQAQPPLLIDLTGAGGHIAVAGGPRSGVSTALAAVVCGVAARCSPSELQVHVLDLAGGLGALRGLPHVGTVVGLHEPVLAAQVVAAVQRELASRAAAPGQHPRLLLVVDGAGLLRGDASDVEPGLAEIAARGLPHDVHLLLGTRRWADVRLGLLDAAGTGWSFGSGIRPRAWSAGQQPQRFRWASPDGACAPTARPCRWRYPTRRPSRLPRAGAGPVSTRRASGHFPPASSSPRRPAGTAPSSLA